MVNKRSAGGRPRGSGRDSQAAIFAAGAREFAEHGYDAAGVDRIAARARVNKAMLYYHYGSKLGLYVEVLRDMFRAVGARARAIADGPGSPEQKLDAWIAAVVEEAGARPWFPPIMLREIASGGAHFDQDTLGMMNGVYFAVRDLIVQGQRAGVFRDADPLLTHLTIMPAILIFFARHRVMHRRQAAGVAAPRGLEQFVTHMQGTARRMLQKGA
jgi:AcrR family transcriptional regulator